MLTRTSYFIRVSKTSIDGAATCVTIELADLWRPWAMGRRPSRRAPRGWGESGDRHKQIRTAPRGHCFLREPAARAKDEIQRIILAACTFHDSVSREVRPQRDAGGPLMRKSAG